MLREATIPLLAAQLGCQSLRSNDAHYATTSTLARNLDLNGDAIFHRLDVTDDAHVPALALQGFEGVDRDVETFGVQRTEAFVDEQRIREGMLATHPGERQSERVRNEEALTAGQCPRRT